LIQALIFGLLPLGVFPGGLLVSAHRRYTIASGQSRSSNKEMVLLYAKSGTFQFQTTLLYVAMRGIAESVLISTS
jgi:hypothetical protein